jgi:phosphoribosylanthranilate isomerase
MIVKICGLSTPETLTAALDAGADVVGFVHYARSPRHVTLEAAPSLVAQVAGRAPKTLLTVDADDELLATAIAVFAPDILQLHGAETPARVATIREKFGRPVMKAIGLGTEADLDTISAYEAVADMLLFDARPTDAAALPGGNGRAFDWTLLAGRSFTKPWLLGGGLTAENVAAAIAATGAQGVDVSSGVETARGVKDSGKIARFIAAARATEKLGSLAESG